MYFELTFSEFFLIAYSIKFSLSSHSWGSSSKLFTAIICALKIQDSRKLSRILFLQNAWPMLTSIDVKWVVTCSGNLSHMCYIQIVFICVSNALMSNEVWLAGESFSTLFTCVGSITGVSSSMDNELWLIVETFPTLRTYIWVFVSVYCLMQSEMRFAIENFPTVCACIRFLAYMTPLM